MSVVSIIVPNFNHASFLQQRIESILQQTYQDFELIILDDCSTDHSRDIIAQYAQHPKVSHVVLNESNSGGPFIQWDKGISLATGKYIWIAESDDWCEASLLQTLVDGIQSDPNCVISYCQLLCVDEKNRIKWRSKHHQLSDLVDSQYYIDHYLAIKVSIYNASMAIFKREAYAQVNLDFTTFKFCGDWYFWLQIARQGKVHISGKVLNYFRKHHQDVSGKAYQSGYNIIEEIKVTNWMYTEKLIGESLYKKAFRKQFKAYWKVKNKIDPTNKVVISALLKAPLSSKINTLSFLPSAIWNALRK